MVGECDFDRDSGGGRGRVPDKDVVLFVVNGRRRTPNTMVVVSIPDTLDPTESTRDFLHTQKSNNRV